MVETPLRALRLTQGLDRLVRLKDTNVEIHSFAMRGKRMVDWAVLPLLLVMVQVSRFKHRSQTQAEISCLPALHRRWCWCVLGIGFQTMADLYAEPAPFLGFRVAARSRHASNVTLFWTNNWRRSPAFTNSSGENLLLLPTSTISSSSSAQGPAPCRLSGSSHLLYFIA